MTIRQKTISGFVWSTLDSGASQVIQFIIGVILARLLTPAEFGLIGMITVFIAISSAFIDGGLSDGLIRKQNVTQADFSTVFYFNIIISFVLSGLLYSVAPLISDFYDENQLTDLLRVQSLILLFGGFGAIQKTTLIKELRFKTQTKITVISSIFSGLIGIVLALKGFGVWSLVYRSVLNQLINTLLLWYWIRWKPSMEFNKRSFQELFSFGSKLLMSRLLDTTYRNIYLLVIGKYFTASVLGNFTRATQFKNLPVQNISIVLTRVAYPSLSMIQDDIVKLKRGYKKMLKVSFLLSSVIMLGMVAIAEPMIITLIGEKWHNAISYLQILCIGGMLYPLQSLNLSILNVKGRSDLFLKLSIIRKILAIPIIVLGLIYGIKIMLIGMTINSFISYYLNSFYSGKQIEYDVKEQIADILPIFLVAVLFSGITFLIGYILPFGFLYKLIIQVLSGGVLIITMLEISKLESYLILKKIKVEYIANVRNERK